MFIASNINSKLVERVVVTDCQSDTLKVVGITTSVGNIVLEQKVCDVFQEIGGDISYRDIQACHHLKDKEQTIVKFTNRKD